jgi:SAM-dependent methyltransferase
MSRQLSARSDEVLGVDISPSAVATARVLHATLPNITFEVGDVLALPPSFDGTFDLVVVADVLYYVSPLDDGALDAIVRRIAALLVPAGVCMVVNHYFFRFDPDSRRSRRIHDAFTPTAGFASRHDHWRPFYLASICQASAPETAGD